jgi:hypothetical protein
VNLGSLLVKADFVRVQVFSWKPQAPTGLNGGA